MIVFVILLIAFFGLVYFLRGEGDKYGAAKTHRDKINVSNKNYFL